MTMQMDYRAGNDPFGSFTSINFETVGVALGTLDFRYDSPARLTFTVFAPQHQLPIPLFSYIRLWDDAGDLPDASSQTSSAPLFEGFIEEVQPADSYRLEYTAYDPSARAGREVIVMSQPWVAGDVSLGTLPAIGVGATPRLVVNCKIDNDDDFVFEREHDLEVGEIIELLLNDQYHPLYWLGAAPGDGSDAGNGSAYVSGDLTGLDFKPQEKVALESENIRDAVTQLLGWEPGVKLIWRPGDRQWRFVDITAASTASVTLNDFTVDHPVLSMSLDRSLDDRWTAVEFYGPEAPTTTTVTDGSGLTAGTGRIIETVGSDSIYVYNTWQVTDSTKRRMTRILPSEVYVQMQAGTGYWGWQPVRAPTLQASWDSGTTWVPIQAVFNYQTGEVTTGDGNYLYIYNEEGVVTSSGTQHYFPPTNVRLVYAYLDSVINVRVPSSGFEGTAYSVGNLESVKRSYEEALAVGYEFNSVPVTSAARLAEYAKLGQRLLDTRKDIIYAGSMVLDGIDYSRAWLNQRINIAAIDADGASLTTGWESIGAWLTAVEYDFGQQTTTLELSSDQMQLVGFNIAQMKEELKLQAGNAKENQQVALTAGGMFYSNMPDMQQRAEIIKEAMAASSEAMKNMFGWDPANVDLAGGELNQDM